jgi:hypothetical protein
VSEIEQRGACILEPLRLGEQLFKRGISAVEFSEDWNSRARDGFDRRFVAELHHVGAGFFEPKGRISVLRARRQIAVHHRALDAAAHRPAHDEHLVEGDVVGARMAPQVDADAVAHRDDVDAGALGDLRDLVVPRNDPDDLAPLAFHSLQIGNGDHAKC